MLEAVQRYNLYCGGGYLPPKWGLGFTQRVPTLYSDKDVLREVNEFEEHNFPARFYRRRTRLAQHGLPLHL